MVSIIVIGRNDDYGINLPKRTAISLNHYASLCEPGDEIIYVDCNTPSSRLTLVEAIADTLTPEARHYLRCYRISGEQMRAALGETPLPFSDTLSRNVALRRSNPANQWVLSTNCDMLLYPLKAPTIAQAIRHLPSKFYVCPRSPITSEQWQMLDRTDVALADELCRAIIDKGFIYPEERKKRWLRFDSNGDFQLAPREQWLAIGGCEEAMKLWGHSDANNARRLSLLNATERTPDVADLFCAMHLEHNPPEIPGQPAPQPVSNDWEMWVRNVTTPRSHNPENWGLRDVDLPLITLEKYGPTSVGEVPLASRRRSYSARLVTRLKAKAWRTMTPLLRTTKRKLNPELYANERPEQM